MIAAQGTVQTTGIHRNLLQERVVFGLPAPDALLTECTKLKKERILLVTSPSYGGDHPLIDDLRRALGSRLAGIYPGVGAHVPRQCVIDGAAAARAVDADLLVALGGGSTTDAAKGILLCLWHSIERAGDLDAFVSRRMTDPSRPVPERSTHVRMLAIPTMLSAAEYTCFAGITDPGRSLKEMIGDPLFIPQTVILDPRATLTVPTALLAATGMKALEHALERLCSPKTNALAEATSTTALKLLYDALPRLGGAGDSLQHRMDCQMAAWLSMIGENSGATVGASHAIGHVIGGYGVPHGHTPGLCLPVVLRWNYESNSQRQQTIAALIETEGRPLADAIAGLAKRLGLPTRLRDVGIGREQLDDIARKVLLDPFIRTNPRPIQSDTEVLQLLESAW